MTEEQIIKRLEHVHQSLENCCLQHKKLVHVMNCSMKEFEQYYQQLLSLFIHETSGRSIEHGLSEKQILLAKSFEALQQCKIELEKHLKRMKRISTLEECLNALDDIRKVYPKE